MANKVAQEAFNHLIGDLRATHGENLASVVLYGSAAAGDHIDESSDYNLLVALVRITPEDLRQAQAPLREWRRLGHPLPVYFTTEELRDAADVFPIEFHQMQRARVVLYGNDPFVNLEISDHNLRHQTEYELRSKLIQLRRLYIPASASIEKLTDLMGESLASFAVLFAPALMLHGVREPPVLKQECVRAAVKQFKLDGEPFERIFEMRRTGAQPASDAEAHGLFTSYLAQIEIVTEAVDELRLGTGK
ncbi:MAG TPA: nucleotidyltransferase domain-containing protein [Pyrinomonadaceae bacterium]|nr:nucleotidyltransferase domain-containing protein [Pyrinomonadaceae bacterium]